MAGSRRATPRLEASEASPVAFLTDIKRELLGSEMRRLVREELASVLREQGALKTQDTLCQPAVQSSGPAINQNTEDPNGLSIHHSVSDLYALGSRPPAESEDLEGMEESTERARSNSLNSINHAFTMSKSTPLNMVNRGGISRLDVTLPSANFWDRMLLRFEAKMNALGVEEPPDRADPLSRLADSFGFDLAVHIMIVTNIVFMAIEADYLLAPSSDDNFMWNLLYVAEIIFVVFYTFEFVVKFARCRWMYFYGRGYGWNWVDFLVLAFSIPVIFQFDHGVEALPAKVIRIMRLSRALRVLQLVAVFKKLRAMLKSLTASISTLACSVAMLVVFLFMFSLLFVMRVGQALSDQSIPVTAEERRELLSSWGGVLIGMLTLLKASTGGRDWAEEHQILSVTGWGTQAVFVAFIAFSQMALLNIILGMFVDQAMKCMASDTIHLARQHVESQKDFRRTTRELLLRVGAGLGNKISLEQWRTCSNKRHLYSYLDFHGFQPNEVDQFFELLSKASPEREVDVEHFVNACIRMKGGASSFSVYEVLLGVSEIESMLQRMQTELRDATTARSAGSAPNRRASTSMAQTEDSSAARLGGTASGGASN